MGSPCDGGPTATPILVVVKHAEEGTDIDQDKQFPFADSKAGRRILLLASAAYGLEPDATPTELLQLAAESRRAHDEGRSPLDLITRMLNVASESRSTVETILIDRAQRCVDGSDRRDALRLEYFQQARFWLDVHFEPFQARFVSTVDTILRGKTAAVMSLSDPVLHHVQQLVKVHAKRAAAELLTGLRSAADVNVIGHNEESVFETLVARCEPRRAIAEMVQAISGTTRGRIECNPDEVLTQLRDEFDTLHPLVEKLRELAPVEQELAGLVEEEKQAYDVVLATYAQERWARAARGQ